jgi:DNA-binding transcriptional LysR family regulator
MRISTRQLEAFYAIAQELSFSRAAERLCVTQSALSQRIKKLEGELGVTLLVRSANGTRLTDVGRRVLRYCQFREALEAEVFRDIAADGSGELTGVLRVAAYSSILRSVVIPALAPFMREHPRVQYQYLKHEVEELPDILRHARADFVILDRRLGWARVTEIPLGIEEYVAVESDAHPPRADVFLDHNPDDRVTEEFFRDQPDPPDYRRSFLDDVYGILDGAAQGLGRAVVSRHLVRPEMRLRTLDRWRPMQREVVLHRYKLPFDTRLLQAALAALQAHCPALLEADATSRPTT